MSALAVTFVCIAAILLIVIVAWLYTKRKDRN